MCQSTVKQKCFIFRLEPFVFQNFEICWFFIKIDKTDAGRLLYLTCKSKRHLFFKLLRYLHFKLWYTLTKLINLQLIEAFNILMLSSFFIFFLFNNFLKSYEDLFNLENHVNIKVFKIKVLFRGVNLCIYNAKCIRPEKVCMCMHYMECRSCLHIMIILVLYCLFCGNHKKLPI